MAPASYRLLFALGVGLFFLSVVTGFGYALVAEKEVPVVEIEDRLPEDLADYREFAAIKPRDPYALVLLGNALMEADENAEAIEIFEKAVGLKAAPPVANERLAWLYLRQGRTEMARRQARAAVRRGREPDPRLLRALGLVPKER
jgi:tetratricopeptide (TPR) repeat protein